MPQVVEALTGQPHQIKQLLQALVDVRAIQLCPLAGPEDWAQSCHWSSARSHCSSCRVRCVRKAAMATAGKVIVRRLLSDLGLTNLGLPLTR